MSKHCPNCNTEKGDIAFDKGVTYCKNCITDICLTPRPGAGKPKMYADYLREKRIKDIRKFKDR